MKTHIKLFANGDYAKSKPLIEQTCLVLFAIASLICTSFTLFAQEKWDNPEVGQMYRNGMQFLNMGNPESAVTTFLQAKKLAPNNFEIKLGLSRAYLSANREKEAEKELKPLLGSANILVADLLAQAQAAQGHTKKALATLKRAKATFPDAGLPYYEAGLIYIKKGNSKKAIVAWEKGIAVEPSFENDYSRGHY